MRKIVLITVFFSLLLSVSVVYSQVVTEWERKVYYERVDRTMSLPAGSSKEDYDRIDREIADKHSLTVDEINDIHKRVWEQNPTEREWEIADELWDRLETLPYEWTEEQRWEVYKEVADK